jgi:hypothetical protein
VVELKEMITKGGTINTKKKAIELKETIIEKGTTKTNRKAIELKETMIKKRTTKTKEGMTMTKTKKKASKFKKLYQ